MKPTTLRAAFSFLVLAALACNLGASGAGQSPATPAVAPVAPAAIATATPPLTPTQEPSPTPEPFSTPDPTPFVTGLTANLQARVASGEWTLEEGLVTTLQFLAGEVNIEAIGQAGVEIHSYAGTGVLRTARNYLQSGADEATKTELQRLITLILPDAETLKRFAQPAQAQTGGSAHLARLNVQPEEEVCRRLWADGWPEGSTAVCFEYRTVEVGEQKYEIFYPRNWPADDPRRAFFEPTVDAVRDSAATFFPRFGAMPSSTTIVFTLLPDPEFPDAYAAADQAAENGTCRVAILPPGIGLSAGAFKQTLAHELFHCFQFKNYWAQTGDAHSLWWMEGTAEYFGNVVYPTVNAESEFWGDFDVNSLGTSLVDMEYQNVVFFQYLANRVGDEGVLRLMDSMPSSGGRAAELSALAGYPDIENLFHSFAKAYLNGEILDTGGGPIGTSPRMDRLRTFDSSRTESIPTNTFVLTRAVFVFPERKRYTITEEGADGLLAAARPLDSEGWAALPTELVSSCGDLIYIYTITKASASDGAQDVSVGSEVEELEESEGCDRCVVGRWEATNDSVITYMQSVIDAGREDIPTVESVTGTMFMEFEAYGTGAAGYENLKVHETGVGGNEGTEAFYTFEGFSSGPYTANGSALVGLSGTTEMVVTVQIVANGVAIGSTTFPVRPEDFPVSSATSTRYTCDGDTLTMWPPVPDITVEPIIYIRTSP